MALIIKHVNEDARKWTARIISYSGANGTETADKKLVDEVMGYARTNGEDDAIYSAMSKLDEKKRAVVVGEFRKLCKDRHVKCFGAHKCIYSMITRIASDMAHCERLMACVSDAA